MYELAKKVVLISNTGYNPKHEKFLQELIQRKIDLFCVVGRDCQVWEDIMDDLCVGDGIKSIYITTTSHEGESVEDVITFARDWKIAGDAANEIEVVEL